MAAVHAVADRSYGMLLSGMRWSNGFMDGLIRNTPPILKASLTASTTTAPSAAPAERTSGGKAPTSHPEQQKQTAECKQPSAAGEIEGPAEPLKKQPAAEETARSEPTMKSEGSRQGGFEQTEAGAASAAESQTPAAGNDKQSGQPLTSTSKKEGEEKQQQQMPPSGAAASEAEIAATVVAAGGDLAQRADAALHQVCGAPPVSRLQRAPELMEAGARSPVWSWARWQSDPLAQVRVRLVSTVGHCRNKRTDTRIHC